MAEESESQSSNSQSLLHKHPKVAVFTGFPTSANGDVQMFPIMYPALIPLQNQEHMNRGAGIYAVPVLPFMGPITGLPSNTLIPLTYNIPTTQSPEAGTGGSEEHGQAGQQQQPAQQRQIVVRRFQIAFQLDLLLILKLAAVIFLFNQEGSRQRLALLVFFATIVYLYQTGALTPLIRWLSQGMQRAAVPPQPPRPPVPAAPRPGNEDAALAGGQARVENENRVGDGGNQEIENENVAAADAEAVRGNQWWGIVKEIQMIVFGFITSLLPGFHHVD